MPLASRLAMLCPLTTRSAPFQNPTPERGGAVGHGVAPFPGGLMCLRLLFDEAGYWRGTLFNLFFWVLTAAIFITLTLSTRQPP